MKLVYKTCDGNIFESEQAAKDHEALKLAPLIIIVDDDPDILETLAHLLNSSSINNKMFLDPFEAMNFISKNKIGHVYTDFHMSGYGMSGKWIKEICNQQKIPCSIVSGDSSIADISKIDFMANFLTYIKG